jgi:hypothetical protein
VGAYTGTSTTFTVPSSFTCTDTDTASSFWAGLDGASASDTTVEQDGVEADCDGGVLSLYAWVETYPAPEEEIGEGNAPAPVEPGDVIETTVTEDTTSDYTFYMDDETEGWYIDTEEPMPTGYTGKDESSEVITEATTECTSATNCTIMPITNFGQVNYSSASYNNATAYTSSNTTPIELVQNDKEADSVGALGAGGAFTVTYGTPDVVVPNVIGRTDLATAESVITAAGLVAKATGDSATGNLGKVTAESPAAGTSVPAGTTVTLTYTDPKVTVPNVIGRTDLTTAESVITAAGLKVKATGSSAAGNKGEVTAESPAAGTSVAPGTTITLTYIVAPVTVPNVIGRADLATAESVITAAGLKVKATGSSAAGNKGKVTAESPAAGTKVAKGSTVTLTYTVAK